MNYSAALGISIATMVFAAAAILFSLRQIRAAKKRRIAAAFGAAHAASYGEDRWSDNEPAGSTRNEPPPNPRATNAPSSPSPWKSGGSRMSYDDEHELRTTTSKPFP